MFEFELVDVAGAVILLLLVVSVWTLIVATPEVADTPEPPASNWSIQEVNDTHMEVVHQEGEPVDKENLTVIVEDYPRPTEWSGEDDGFVREGDSATVQVSRDQDVALYWTGIDTVRREVLAEGRR